MALSRRSFVAYALGAGLALDVGDVVVSPRTASAADTPVPPELLAGQALTSSTVRLLWTAVTGAETYRVYRDNVLIAEQPGTLLEDGGLTATTTYSYEVTTVIGGVESARSAPVVVVTQRADPATGPTAPTNLKTSSLTSSGVKLSWTKSTAAAKITGYRILRGAVGAPLESLVQIATTDGTTSYTASKLFANRAYQFAVRAVDVAGHVGPAAAIDLTTKTMNDTSAPSAVSNSSVVVKRYSDSRLDITWGSSSSSDVAGYQVYRNNVLIATVEEPLRKTYSDNGLSPSTSYTYRIAAVDSAGNVSALTSGRAGSTPAAGTVLVTRGPYVVQTDRTSARVLWWTNLPTDSTVDFGVGTFSDSVFDPTPRLQHAMLLGGLEPGTEYVYQVRSGNATLAGNRFTTAPAPGTAFTFAAVGDFGGGSGQQTSIANLIAASSTSFLQTLGDNVYPDAQDPDPERFYSDFDNRFYKQYGAVIRTRSLYPANGNKEYYGDGAAARNLWSPNNQRWYSYDWGDLHVLVVDSEQPMGAGSAQRAFVDADLSATTAAWKICVVHRPPYSSTTSTSSSSTVLAQLVPRLELYGVRLCLSGNSHNYERSHPLRAGVTDPTGVTYIVSGGGGNGLNQFTASQPSWSAYRSARFEYVQCSVSPTQLVLNAYSDTGELFDSTTLTQ
ncbi:fibronectin type III domain-containing protein [Streptomyces sp. NPDC015661]|uniref:fibronectin type III domain-containing protein n=1 Tax=Streptomyces sp. NPDC015661 TaxID=3364961 RepID=UPI0036FFDCB7